MSRRWISGSAFIVFAGVLVVYAITGLEHTFPWGPAFLVGLGVGALLVWKAPGNRVGWVLFLFGAGTWIGGIGPALARVASDQVAAGWFDAVGNSINTAAVLALPLVLLVFPDGELPGPRWRGLAWLIVSTAVLGGLVSLLNGGWGGDQTIAEAVSPLYEPTNPLGDVIGRVFYTLVPFSFAIAAASVLLRYQRSEGEVRLQIKWLLAAGVFVLVGMVVLVAANGFRIEGADQLWEQTTLASGFAAIPAAVGVAVLRYRLYDIDLVINRAVVLAVLAGFITAIYVVVVVVAGQTVGGDSDELFLPILATAVVAVAFEPVRQVAQKWANRLVYGNRATPYEVLSDLTERLSEAEQGAGILAKMAELLCAGTGAERATVWLDDAGVMKAAATEPVGAPAGDSVDLDSDDVFPVIHDAEVVGALEVVKPRGTVLSSVERSLIADLAGSAGAVLGYQKLNDSLAARAAELEESRGRLLGVQGAERRRLEQDLHEGAEQYIVALKVKIGVASQLAGRAGDEKLEQLLMDLTEETQAALDDVQSLAKGIYPPVLESDGLDAAVSALASSAPVEVVVVRAGVERLPADLEAAVYFDISEAVTNAVKHASPPIRIELSQSNGVLSFTVSDSGPGFDLDLDNPGSGLENMADRLETIGGRLVVDSEPGSATVVSGTVPLG